MREIDVERQRKYLPGYSDPDYVAMFVRALERLSPEKKEQLLADMSAALAMLSKEGTRG